MSNIVPIHYFGKLRRRREFVKASGLARDYYYDWEVWFNKCSNTNSLLPFLSTRNKDKPIWLFIINQDETLKIGLTTLSSDLAERKHPFLVYFETEIIQSDSLDRILLSIISMTGKYDGFVSTVANGDFTIEEEQYFKSLSEEYKVADLLKETLKSIALEIIEKKYSSFMNSYWVNLDNFSTITHQGALTCTLYNKIYG